MAKVSLRVLLLVVTGVCLFLGGLVGGCRDAHINFQFDSHRDGPDRPPSPLAPLVPPYAPRAPLY